MATTADEEISVSPLQSPISSPTPQDEHACSVCEEKMKQPKVLHCLHVFCLSCLEKLEAKKIDEEPFEVIECPTCKQETRIPEKGLSELQPDHVLVDMMRASDIEDEDIICTSCKAKEQAVARCNDCDSFLCPNCVTAHQFMRCFDNHKVVAFKDVKNGDSAAFHKPAFCTTHPSESLKLYCTTCQEAHCVECDHKEPSHKVEKITDLEEQERNGLETLISESKAKVESCEEAITTLQNSLGELQSQRDNAKDLVNETFQSYKAVLEKRKDDLIEELEALHSAQELAVMELCHNVEKNVEKLEDGCKFTERVLNNGSALHILLLKNLISNQLVSLVNNTPNPEFTINLEFKTDSSAFEEAVKKHFGSFKKEEKEERPPSSLHSSFENEGFNLQRGILPPDASSMMPQIKPADFVLPARAGQEARMADLNFPGLGTIPPIGAPLPGATQPRSASRSSHSPAMSDSGISVDAASTNSSSSVPMVNIAALAKLGTVGYSSQGMEQTGCGSLSDPISASSNSQVTFNGQVVPGLNMSNITGLPAFSSRGPTPPGMGSPTPSQNTTNYGIPNLENLANIWERQVPPPQNVPPGMGGFRNLQTNIQNLGYGISSGGSVTPNPGNVTPTFPSSGLSGSNSSLNTVGTESSGTMPAFPPPVRKNNKMSAMQIRCKFGQLGPGKGQFNSPHGFCLGEKAMGDKEESIVICDTNNHRIQIFEKSGEFCYQFGIPGREEGQLWYPRKVAVMQNSGKYVVCDRGNERSRMQIFTKNGHFIRKIAIRYIDIVAGLAITSAGHIVAVDSVSPTVFVIAESGELIKWFDCSDYMREPSDIAISGKEYFVCDFKGHCVVVFNEEGIFMRRIGCENITNYPNGIDISDAGDVLVGDSHGNRFHVAVFQRDGSLIGEFECPYVKVSRCCGLKITREGYVVTLAKNNHHVLVLNTLYIT